MYPVALALRRQARSLVGLGALMLCIAADSMGYLLQTLVDRRR